MLFNSAFISSVFFISAVLADRRRELRQSGFLNRVEQSSDVSSGDVQYNTNWAGAVWVEGDGTFSFVTGTFTVPVPKGSPNTTASAWVGIDGATCNSAGLLQGGVDFTLDGNGGVSSAAWYEWYPDYSYYFSEISISAGDVIRVNITALSTTSGRVTIENLSNGQSGGKRLGSVYPICQENAEWIVEDYSDYTGNLLPFANFTTVTFDNVMAIGNGSTYTPDGAAIFDIQQNGQTLTSVSTHGSSVTITYV